MAWRAITEADVETVLAGPELEALRSAAGASDGGEDDKLDLIISMATDLARGHIEDCAENRVGPAGTVPERTIFHALVIARTRLLSRLNMEQGETRATEHKDATAFFERVSACKVKIEQPNPDEVVEEANTPSMETLISSPPKMGKEQIGKLF